MKLKIGISPCPNDTYLFYAWIHKKIHTDIELEPLFADVQELNVHLKSGRLDISKVSFYTLIQLYHAFTYLPIGAALGFENGPMLVKTKDSEPKPFIKSRVAIPGRDTTAYLLLRMFQGKPKHEDFCIYHEVPVKVQKGLVDYGLIIHETRFQLDQLGLEAVADYGKIWQAKTSLPLPLGCLAISRKFNEQMFASITDHLQRSLIYARQNTKEVLEYCKAHSIEKDESILKQHVDLYVNTESEGLSQVGNHAIQRLIAYAQNRLSAF